MSAPQPLRFERKPGEDRAQQIRAAHMLEFGPAFMAAIEGALVGIFDVPKEDAEYAAYDVLRRLMDACGGSYVYVPKGVTLAMCEREQAMWREYDGRNIRELAKKYRVGLIHAYEIIRSARKKQQERQQTSLFGQGDDQGTDPQECVRAA